MIKCHFMTVNNKQPNSTVTYGCGSTGAGLFRSESRESQRKSKKVEESRRESKKVRSQTQNRTPSVEPLLRSLRAIMEVMSCELWRCSVPAGAHFASSQSLCAITGFFAFNFLMLITQWTFWFPYFIATRLSLVEFKRMPPWDLSDFFQPTIFFLFFTYTFLLFTHTHTHNRRCFFS